MARAGLTTERVVAAAADLADQVGLEKVTLSALARGFGVKDASLYSHVRNSQDLRVRLALLAAGELADRIVPAVAGLAGRDALSAFARTYRDYALAHPGRYAATQLPLDQDTVAASPAAQRSIAACSAILRGYGLAEPDLIDAGRLLRATLHGYVSLEAAGGFGHARPVQVSFERSITALHLVLSHWVRSDRPIDPPAPWS
ncbi:TetR-like C-terminal domain-containing protein [Kitasatospora sp. NPDC008050]|uniref:TetR-like C-terminal domain-containing protein n=1 Tax=Kitasatospora sp. NPDC008050 TaxID=3364021 RepID=UPI0036E080F9